MIGCWVADLVFRADGPDVVLSAGVWDGGMMKESTTPDLSFATMDELCEEIGRRSLAAIILADTEEKNSHQSSRLLIQTFGPFTSCRGLLSLGAAQMDANYVGPG